MPESQKQHSPDNEEFKFVAESNRKTLRSHAMRAHWRQRKQWTGGQRGGGNGTQRHLRPLLPHRRARRDCSLATHHAENGQDTNTCALASSNQLPTKGELAGEASRALYRMIGTVACGRLDPFDRLPITLTVEHQELLHHWVFTCTTMMFGHLPPAIANPMRDVWLPLDLSNAGSFNACMAHSAAHLARMRGHRYSKRALEFKMEAIRIIMGWIGDHNMALSDVTFAAVLRLSTYERYWGTELDWQIHHDGLLRMINARGGLGTFAHNWRLALIAFLNTLMVRPSWLDSSNRIWELAMPQSLYALRLIVGEESSMHQIRCLWLLSLGQDIEHFALISIESCRNGLASCANLQDALMLLMLKMKQYDLTSRRDAKIGDFEFRRLACVLFIAILCQGCTTAPADASALSQGSGWISCPLALILLDVHLLEYRDTWLSDVDGLYVTLYSGFFGVDDGIPNRDYVLTMASVLGSMSSTTRQRIESSLLHILCSGAAA